MIALASYPRSGNTWMRILIERATDRPVDSVSMDRPYPEIATGEPIAWKTHYLPHREFREQRFTKAIHLVRHPYDAIVSYWHYKRDFEYLDLLWEDHVLQQLRPPRVKVEGELPTWGRHTADWEQEDTLPVRYEDLLADTAGVLAKVCEFLQVPHENLDNAVAKSTIRYIRGQLPPDPWVSQFYRQGQCGKGVRMFAPVHRELARKVFGDIAERWGYAL